MVLLGLIHAVRWVGTSAWEVRSSRPDFVADALRIDRDVERHRIQVFACMSGIHEMQARPA